jgi:hypothetical protein
MANLILEYPLWYLLLCASVATGYALGLYYKDRSFGEETRWLNKVLGTLRWLTVFIICLLLLTPVLRYRSTERKAPIVVLAQDNSASLLSAMDSTQRQAYQKQMEQLQQALKEQYDLRVYSFGDQVREGADFSFTDKATNISAMMNELYDLFSGQNLSTVILATDGIYNQGNNPLYAATKLNTPIFSIALGDTIPKKDLVLRKVYNNQIAYLGDKFSVQVDIAATNCKGSSTQLQVSQDGRVLYSENISLDNEDFFTTKEFLIEAKRAGVQRYTISLSGVSGELTAANNVKEMYIDVLDARQKILLLAESPHPDMAALRRLIEANKNYEVTLEYADQLKEPVTKYDFVVLHQLPSQRNGIAPILTALKDKRIPHWFIVGTQTNLMALNQAQNLLSTVTRLNQTNDVEGVLETGFNAFTLNAKVGEKIPRFPPLAAPFGEFSAKPGSMVVLWQKIGSITTKYPLLILGEEQGIKKGILAAEGIWKWRLNDYMQHQTHEIFDEFFGKVIQYLSTKEDKRKFRAFASSNLYNENEAVVIDAELYNSNYERINEPEARVELVNDKGEKFPYTFNRTANNTYSIKPGLLPVGRYRFEAKTSFNGENLLAGGEFSVQPIQLEVFETTADHRSLALMSERSAGQLLYPNQIAELPKLIQAKGYGKPQLFDTITTRSLIHLKWIFFLLLFLLSAEWFLRRYYGSY